MTDSPKRCNRPKAFTMVELLVVLAIIAILVLLVMPLGRDIGARVNRVTCANRLHHIGAAYQAYTADEKHLSASQWQYQLAPYLDWDLRTTFTCPEGGMPMSLIDWLAGQEDPPDDDDTPPDPPPTMDNVTELYYQGRYCNFIGNGPYTNYYRIHPTDQSGQWQFWWNDNSTWGIGNIDPFSGFPTSWYLTEAQFNEYRGQFPALRSGDQWTAVAANAAWLPTDPLPAEEDVFYVITGGFSMSPWSLGNVNNPGASPYHASYGSYADGVIKFRRLDPSGDGTPRTEITWQANPLTNYSYSGGGGIPSGCMPGRAYGPGSLPSGADGGKVMYMRDWAGSYGMAIQVMKQDADVQGTHTGLGWIFATKSPSAVNTHTGYLLGVHTPGGPFGDPVPGDDDDDDGSDDGEFQNGQGLSYGVNYNITRIPTPGNRPPRPDTVLVLDYYLLVARGPVANESFDEMFSMTYETDSEGEVLRAVKRHVIGGVHHGHVLQIDGAVNLMTHEQIDPDDHPERWNMP